MTELNEPTTLAEALDQANLQLTPEIVAQLDAYRELLWEWNEKINLTRHTTLAKFVDRDVVDSLALADKLPPGARVLDIGSGGGTPGLVLAIARPDLRVSVCDSVAKKARVLDDLVTRLELPVKVYPTRVQEVLEVTTFDTLVARGVAPLAKLLTWLAPHWEAFEELLLIKGQNWVAERGEARHLGLMHGLALRKASEYQSPRHDCQSVILRISRGSSDAD